MPFLGRKALDPAVMDARVDASLQQLKAETDGGRLRMSRQHEDAFRLIDEHNHLGFAPRRASSSSSSLRHQPHAIKAVLIAANYAGLKLLWGDETELTEAFAARCVSLSAASWRQAYAAAPDLRLAMAYLWSVSRGIDSGMGHTNASSRVFQEDVAWPLLAVVAQKG